MAHLLPPRKPCGRKPTDPRAILNAIFYMVRTACPWRYLPKDFPPFTTVQNRFYAWRDSGLWEQIVSVLVVQAREAEGKAAAPTVVIVDSQSVKTTEAGGERGYDVAKATKGRNATLRSGLSHMGLAELSEEACEEGIVPCGAPELAFH